MKYVVWLGEQGGPCLVQGMLRTGSTVVTGADSIWQFVMPLSYYTYSVPTACWIQYSFNREINRVTELKRTVTALKGTRQIVVPVRNLHNISPPEFTFSDSPSWYAMVKILVRAPMKWLTRDWYSAHKVASDSDMGGKEEDGDWQLSSCMYTCILGIPGSGRQAGW